MKYDLKAYELKDFLSELIKIPSVNPDGDPGTTVNNTGAQDLRAWMPTCRIALKCFGN